MRLLAASLLALFALAPTAQAQTCQPVGPAWRTADFGRLPERGRSEISGLACAPAVAGQASCVLVQDEGHKAAVARLEAGEIRVVSVFDLPNRAGKGELDAEAAAYHDGWFYVLGSHSVRAKSCILNADSRVLVRFRLDAAGRVRDMTQSRPVSDVIQSVPALAGSLGQCLGRERPKDASGNWRPRQGLNIEGLAVVGGRVYLGLRGPVRNGAAQIVETGLEALFGAAPPRGQVVGLKLTPEGGVRDLAAHEGGLLILSGAEDDAPGEAAIHLWDRASPMVRHLCGIPEAGGDDRPEALLALGGGAVLVLSDGPKDGNPRAFRVPIE